MSHYYDFKQALEIRTKGYTFYSLIIAAMMKADGDNSELLKTTYPELWEEAKARYNAPGSKLPTD